MKEKFFVLRVLLLQPEVKNNMMVVPHGTFILNNPNDGLKEPPIFDTYPEAENWIKENGAKNKYYQIQKFLMPI
jgi:hypothetical protein